jgi:hypothetical protein
MMDTLRTVDSYCQLVDRLIVCRLKEFHYRIDGAVEAEETARMQAEELSASATTYLRECFTHDREPRVNQHLRKHEHKHAFDLKAATSLSAVISQLTSCHAKYWQAQGRIVEMRKNLEGAGSTGYEEVLRALHNEQLVCDGCNQVRNQLIQQGDQMLQRMWKIDKAAR